MIKEEQNLNCEFLEYPNLCVRLLRETLEENVPMWPEFTIHHDGSGRLIIMKETSIKIFKVFMIDFSPMPDDLVKQSISYR